MQCGQSVQLLNVKLLVRHVTSRLKLFNYYSKLEEENCKASGY